MKTIKENGRAILLTMCILIAGYPLVINIKNPEITQMELFLNYWWVYLICLILAALSLKFKK